MVGDCEGENREDNRKGDYAVDPICQQCAVQEHGY